MDPVKVSTILSLMIIGSVMIQLHVGREGMWLVGGINCYAMAWVYGYLMRRR